MQRVKALLPFLDGIIFLLVRNRVRQSVSLYLEYCINIQFLSSQVIIFYGVLNIKQVLSLCLTEPIQYLRRQLKDLR